MYASWIAGHPRDHSIGEGKFPAQGKNLKTSPHTFPSGMIIGITGNFGSGKSTVSGIFKASGFSVIDVDRLYRGIYRKDKKLRNRVKACFGTADRRELKRIVFNDYEKLKLLNRITHPIIIKEIKKKIKGIKKKSNGKRDIAIDAPLLLESNAKMLVDKIVVVKAKKSISSKRLLAKGYTHNEIRQITKSQMPVKEKIKHSHYIIDNSISIEDTKKQAIGIIKEIRK